jgi:hypothetical protein
MGDMEYGRCDICKTQNQLTRTYYYFPIACQCCSRNHFEMVTHCADCKPVMPRVIKIELATRKALDPIHEGLFKKVRE